MGYGKKVYLKQYQRSCFRAKCKVCFVKWIGRQANRSTHRIEAYQKQNKGEKPIHIFFSVPRYLYGKSYGEMKQELRKILKRAGIVGGAVVFHPFRFKNRKWYWSPHFHMVGFGSYRNITNVFGHNGWYVGNAGVRKSVFHTFHYLFVSCRNQSKESCFDMAR